MAEHIWAESLVSSKGRRDSGGAGAIQGSGLGGCYNSPRGGQPPIDIPPLCVHRICFEGLVIPRYFSGCHAKESGCYFVFKYMRMVICIYGALCVGHFYEYFTWVSSVIPSRAVCTTNNK